MIHCSRREAAGGKVWRVASGGGWHPGTTQPRARPLRSRWSGTWREGGGGRSSGAWSHTLRGGSPSKTRVGLKGLVFLPCPLPISSDLHTLVVSIKRWSPMAQLGPQSGNERCAITEVRQKLLEFGIIHERKITQISTRLLTIEIEQK